MCAVSVNAVDFVFVFAVDFKSLICSNSITTSDFYVVIGFI